MPEDVAHPSMSKALFTQDSILLEFEPRIGYGLHKVCHYGESCCSPVDAFPRSVSGVEDQVTNIRIPDTKVGNDNVTPEMTYR